MQQKGRGSLSAAVAVAKEKKTYIKAQEASRISNRKFTEEQIRYIRNAYSTGEKTQKELAKEFGCSREPIYKIVNFKSYKHVV
jgi:predicted DNA binding protein